ncbi:MAG: TetR/AcrR family transcriptional regulator [Acidimicrobiia bacterium]
MAQCAAPGARGQGLGGAVHAPVTKSEYLPDVVAAREPAARRTGRPRRSPRSSAGDDPRREIVAAAGQLFAEHGVAGTTMAEIARRCGLQQPSLYYYFRSKGELLDEIAADANRAPLQLVARVRDGGGTPAVQLYRIIRADVAALCALPYDLNEIHRLAARDRATFARYWVEREHLVDELGAVIGEGVDRGELRPVDPRLTALTLMSNDEGTQNWLRVAGRDGEPVQTGVAEHHAVGSFLADLAVRGLLVAPRDLDRIRRAADALDAAAVVA